MGCGLLSAGALVGQFSCTELNDTELHSVTSILSDHQPLELDLGKTRVTDAGILQLADLEKLTRVGVGGTAVSDAATARLQLRLLE